MLRSIASVVAGVVVWGALWVSANLGLAAAFPASFDESGATRSVGLLLVFLGVSVVLSLTAGYLCAAIARRSMMLHVGILAALQLAIGIFVQAGVWDLMPIWYHLVFLGLVVPMHLAGGNVRRGRRPEVSTP